MRILLVEDDELLTQILTDHLITQHYVVDIATDGVAGFDYAQLVPYDLIVLDVNLPQLDGIRLCQMLRQNRYSVPILLLTAKGESSDKVMGLDAGADDYVVKPCTVEEISARIRALLRRSSTGGTPLLTWGNLCLDPVACEVTCDQKPLALSPKEYSLLELFLRHPQRIFSSQSILENLWSFADSPGEETIRSHIKRLRRKLKEVGTEEIIDTIYGMGYRLKPEPSPAPSAPSPTDSAADEARLAAISVWDRFKQPILERVAVLDQALNALEAGYLSEDMRQAAICAAHKLTGSLGMFGFSAGTPIGQEIEQLLQSPAPIEIAWLKSRLAELHHMLPDATAVQAVFPPGLPAPRSVQASVSSSGQPIAAIQVLAVDDDPIVLAWLNQYLPPQGIHVTTLNTLDEFWQTLTTTPPDLLILDVEMPAASGIELCQEIRHDSTWDRLPILFLTARREPDVIIQIFAAGADDYVSKPVTELDVTTRIFNRLERNRRLQQVQQMV
jgi:two-component system OmpR family response regulator